MMEEDDPFAEFDEQESDDPFAEFDEEDSYLNDGIDPNAEYTTKQDDLGVSFGEEPEAPPAAPEEREAPGWGNTIAKVVARSTPVNALIEAGTTMYDYWNGPTAKEDKGLIRKGLETVQGANEGLVGGLVVNAPRAAGELGMAIASGSPIAMGVEKLTGYDINPVDDIVMGAYDKAVPEYVGQNMAQEAGALAGEVMAGIVVGNKVQAAMKAAGASSHVIQSLVDKAPRFTKYLSNVVTSAAGTATTMDGDSDTLVLGPNAYLPLFDGLDGKSQSEAQQVLEGRMNILLDSMILAAPIELLADGGKALFSAFGEGVYRPLRAAFADKSGKYKEGLVIEDFVRSLRDAIDPKNPKSKIADEYVKKVFETLDSTEEGQLVFKSLTGGDETVKFDTATTLNRGLDDFKGVAGDEAEASSRMTRVKDLFDTKLKGSLADPDATQTKAAASAPGRALSKELDEGYESLGGEKAVEDASLDVRQGTEREVKDAFQPVRETEAGLQGVKDDFLNALEEDEQLGADMLKRSGDEGSQIGLRRDKAIGDLVGAFREGSNRLIDENKILWRNLPEGLEVDEDSLAVAIEDAYEYMTPDVKKAFKRAGVDIDAVMSGEVIEDASPIDFMKLQNELRTPLSAAIKQSIEGNKGTAGILTQLRDHLVRDQPEFLAGAKGRGSVAKREGAKALEAAVEDTARVGSIAKSGVPNRIRLSDRKAGLNKVEADAQAYKIVADALETEHSPLVKHMVETLNRPEYGGKAGLVLDAGFAKVIDDMDASLRAGEVTDVKAKDILKALAPFRTAFNQNADHFGPQLKKLDAFEKRVIEGEKRGRQLTDKLKTVSKEAETKKRTIYETDLPEFFTPEGDPLPHPKQSFKDMFKKKQLMGSGAEGRLEKLVQKLTPEGKKGAQAAWLETVKETVYNADGSLNTTAAANMASGKDNQLLEVGRRLFADEPGTVDVIEELVNPSIHLQRVKKGASAKPGKGAGSSEAAKRAAARLVLATKGPLTKTGGRITSAVGSLLEYVKPDEKTAKIIDGIMADPKEFMRLIRDFEKRENRSKEKIRAVFHFLVKSGVYNEADENKFRERLAQADEYLEAVDLGLTK